MARPWWPPDAVPCPPAGSPYSLPPDWEGETRREKIPILISRIRVPFVWFRFPSSRGELHFVASLGGADDYSLRSYHLNRVKEISVKSLLSRNVTSTTASQILADFPCSFGLWKIGKTNNEMDRKLSRPNLVISSGTSRGYSEAGEAVDWSVTRPPC